VIAGANATLKQIFDLSPFWLGFTVSSALWGTVLGSMLIVRPLIAWFPSLIGTFGTLLVVVLTAGSIFYHYRRARKSK